MRARYHAALSHLHAALPFEFWLRVTCCPRSPIATMCRCACTCTINGRPRGVPHMVHSCCLLTRDGGDWRVRAAFSR